MRNTKINFLYLAIFLFILASCDSKPFYHQKKYLYYSTFAKRGNITGPPKFQFQENESSKCNRIKMNDKWLEYFENIKLLKQEENKVISYYELKNESLTYTLVNIPKLKATTYGLYTNQQECYKAWEMFDKITEENVLKEMIKYSKILESEEGNHK